VLLCLIFPALLQPRLGSVQKSLPILAGAPPGQMQGPREGVYPLRYSTD